MTEPLLDPDGIARLRDALTTHGYTSAGIAGRIGPAGTAAMGRNDFRAALRATEERDPLGTLIRLFECGQSEPAPAVARALRPLPLADAATAGLIRSDGAGTVRAAVDLEPYGPAWWVLADRPALGGPLPADHVLGVGGASTTLANAIWRRPVHRALDIGTGCGVQALHLSTVADHVTATDISGRALRFAATGAALSNVDIELLAGDLAGPVAGRRYDLVVSNPPFIVGPPGEVRYTYRDSGRAGDAVGAELAAAASDLLTEGGTMQYLANWLHVDGEPWTERVAGWIAGTGLDAWIVQREVTDPLAYVNLWLADASETVSPTRTAAWLDWFDRYRVSAIGFGLVTLRRGGHPDPVVTIEELRQPIEGRLGDQVADWFGRQDWLRGVAGAPAGLTGQRLRVAGDVRLIQEATRGDEGWAVDRQLLSRTGGLHRTEEIDPLVLALVSGCDGTVALADQLDLLAAAHQVPPAELSEVALPIVRELITQGYLEPAPPVEPAPLAGASVGDPTQESV